MVYFVTAMVGICCSRKARPRPDRGRNSFAQSVIRKLSRKKTTEAEHERTHSSSSLSVIEELSEMSFEGRSARRYTLDPDAPMYQFMRSNRKDDKEGRVTKVPVSRLEMLRSQHRVENSEVSCKPLPQSTSTSLCESLQKVWASLRGASANTDKTVAGNICTGRPNDWTPPKYCGSSSSEPKSLKVKPPPKKLFPVKGANRVQRSTVRASAARTTKTKKPRPFFSIFRVIVALSLCVCIGGAGFLGITLGTGDSTLLNPQPESPLRQFMFSLQVQEIDNQAAEWTSDLKEINSPKAQDIIRTLRPRIRSAFELEGLKTDSIYVTEIGPVSVTLYSIFNSTITSLTSDEEINMISNYEKESGINIAEENKPRRQGNENIIRIGFETSGRPSENAGLLSQVGETENNKIQRMLDKYLGNLGVIAKAESFAVSPEFRRTARLVTNSASDVVLTNNGIDDMSIDCYRSGETLGVTRATLICPPKCKDVEKSVVIGTDGYYISSMICLAAIHSGLIENDKGGKIEYIQSGNAFLFLGSSSNGVTSTSLFKYGRRFYVKKPGPSWTTTVPPTAYPVYAGLQGSRGTLMTGHVTVLSVDGTPLVYTLSLSYSSKLKKQMTELLQNKLFYSLEDMGFRVEKVIVSRFEAEVETSALRFAFEIEGHFDKNQKAISPYMPLDEDKTNALNFTLSRNLLKEGLGTSGLTFEITETFQTSWTGGGSDGAVSNEETEKLVCGCVDVFFLVDTSAFKSESNARNVLRMYKQIFGLGNFDQFNIRFGVVVAQTFQSPHLTMITDIGDLSVDNAVKNLEIELMSAAAEGAKLLHSTNQLWLDFYQQIANLRFFTEDLQLREKLLVIYSEEPLRRSHDDDEEIFKTLMSKGIRILSIGYSRESEGSIYQKYVSEPTQDFFKRVQNIGNLLELSSYTIEVMRKYSCAVKPGGICSKQTTEDASSESDSIQPSYARGIPSGSGLKKYKISAGLNIDGRLLAKTSSHRLTEPDETQAFYTAYECGKSREAGAMSFQGKIVGGTEATPHTWPWIVSINRLRSRHNTLTDTEVFTYNFWVCGGTIISSEWVITAAHCFAKGSEKRYTTSYKILAGAHDQEMLREISSKDVYEIRRILYYPLYDDPMNKFDRAITFRPEISPACLPNPDVIPATGKLCVVAGWGYTSTDGDTPRNILKQAVQIVENPSRCQQVYRKLSYDPNYNICSKKSGDGKVDMQCRGDSGGPLVCYENKRWVLYGVANYGPRDCDKGGHGVYLLVSSVMEWLCCYVSVELVPCTNTVCNTKLS